MSYTFVISVVCLALAGLGCDRVGASVPTAPSVPPAVAPAPPPVPFPSIVVGEVVRFQFTAEFSSCVKAGGACRSYNVNDPSDGQLTIVLTPVSGDDGFVSTTEMYVVPGADNWDVGPGARISATIPARAGATYEIRMFSSKVPSVELELRASLQ